ncbi:urease accessory protein UreE [Gilvimarinus xylanilyticus]|uniref:Urease accessory protein UreE n=1 Tax=Gilvimarinus xylanilyticus TaxID=2944139 RepID=A0A9X2I0T0_9GAMM|nr:urease accessory protein UreE [Gilvimarinus xylanilyticus]MCP8898235.1 urease accessory protein UreE [Gilvimarinus xylanilyticus]
MLEAFKVVQGPARDDIPVVELTFEQRQKSRYRTQTRCGQTLGWFVERGHVLADGELLECSDGTRVLVEAALETVSNVVCDDRRQLARVAYHLGNRHVPLQVGDNFVRYQHDHVLDIMVKGLGLAVECKQAPFNPENGAYHGGSHGHSHDHAHEHSHTHQHSHEAV